MTAHSKDEGLRECPFCGAQPYVADPTNFPGMWEHPWEHKGCFLDGFNITGVTSWNRRSSSAAERGLREALSELLAADDAMAAFIIAVEPAVLGETEWAQQHHERSARRRKTIAKARAALSARAGEEEQGQATRGSAATAPTDRL